MRTFEAGTVVKLKDGRLIDIKEYVHQSSGLYEGNDLHNFQKVYFGREVVKKVVSRPKRLDNAISSENRCGRT